MRLAGKVCIVTGAGSGIGRASARLFAQEGARVVAADVDKVAARETCDTIDDAFSVRTDVTSEEDTQSLA
ncbi:MAG: hypothetical protein QOF43_1123, partial [Gaiellaceae bacterium]|nr:hypothetical protein [Gaiellaceae bacterium]